jgi:hypothetical protein
MVIPALFPCQYYFLHAAMTNEGNIISLDYCGQTEIIKTTAAACMKKLIIYPFFPVAALAAVIAFNKALVSETTRHPYVGSAVCAECHTAESIGDQYDHWLRSPHSKALSILKKEAGLTIGKKLSIPDPSKDPACLKCHTTGGGRYEKTRNEGVGCEACHGPGGDYYEYGRHVNAANRQGGYKSALKYGMYPVLGIRRIKQRERLCLHCHNHARACFPSDPREVYRQSISLQVISDMRKGSLVLSHPLIPPFPQY